MVDPIILLNSVILLFLFLIPGYFLKKFNLIGESFAGGISNLILYALQPAMIVRSFAYDYNPRAAVNILWSFVFSALSIGAFYLITNLFFGSCPERKRKVLRYSVVFSNAGYMGMPLVTAVCGPEAAICVSAYIISFNVYAWSIGCLIYTGDKKYISVKKILINPATVPTYIGLLIFFLPINGYIPEIVIGAMDALKEMVAPMSMILVGIKLAEVKFKGTFRDGALWLNMALRLAVMPVVAFLIIKAAVLLGAKIDPVVPAVTLICAATPAASATCIFAEKFNEDSVYAGKIVSISTLISVVTMPLAVLLLKIL